MIKKPIYGAYTIICLLKLWALRNLNPSPSILVSRPQPLKSIIVFYTKIWNRKNWNINWIIIMIIKNPSKCKWDRSIRSDLFNIDLGSILNFWIQLIWFVQSDSTTTHFEHIQEMLALGTKLYKSIQSVTFGLHQVGSITRKRPKLKDLNHV